MNICGYDNLIKILRNKKKSCFSGTLKLCFEKGIITSMHESNIIDYQATQNSNKGMLLRLKKVIVPSFYGFVVIIYVDGNIIKWLYNRSIKNSDLLSYMESLC